MFFIILPLSMKKVDFSFIEMGVSYVCNWFINCNFLDVGNLSAMDDKTSIGLFCWFLSFVLMFYINVNPNFALQSILYEPKSYYVSQLLQLLFVKLYNWYFFCLLEMYLELNHHVTEVIFLSAEAKWFSWDVEFVKGFISFKCFLSHLSHFKYFFELHGRCLPYFCFVHSITVWDKLHIKHLISLTFWLPVVIKKRIL